MAQETILVVEDEKDILDLVEYNLQGAGFRVLRAMDGIEGLRLAKSERPELIILDLMLPNMDGKEVCRRIRQDEHIHAIPVMMLTARTEEIDRIVGFELGADDYLTKPFSPRELALRVQAILRRLKEAEPAKALIQFPGMIIDSEKHRLEVDGQGVDLTVTEFRLLHYLATNPGKVQTRDALLDRVWGYTFEGYARTVDTHIRRLRKKLGAQKDRIDTIRGIGYRFREDI
ncbi:MAG: response regulator transcription factor [Deltaproteobacteria bacterium]|nr:response regulator transcription factor [Deltaproteobacteria bacterium]